ncbi:trans-sialidase [Trypanosoma cruzi]|nr:trans-sialidase [Trypanosoma cruzi]
MPRLLLYVLVLFFLLNFCPNVPAHALAPGSSRIELFKRKNSTVPFEDRDGKVTERVVHSFRLPALVNVDGVMVAIADARYTTSNDNSLIDTVVKYSVDDGETWETQIAIKNSRVSSVSRVVDPTVIVKGNKLYVLVGSYNSSKNYWTWQPDGSDWDILLAVGVVTKSTVDGKTTANITWGSPVSLKEFFPGRYGRNTYKAISRRCRCCHCGVQRESCVPCAGCEHEKTSFLQDLLFGR